MKLANFMVTNVKQRKMKKHKNKKNIYPVSSRTPTKQTPDKMSPETKTNKLNLFLRGALWSLFLKWVNKWKMLEQVKIQQVRLLFMTS